MALGGVNLIPKALRPNPVTGALSRIGQAAANTVQNNEDQRFLDFVAWLQRQQAPAPAPDPGGYEMGYVDGGGGYYGVPAAPRYDPNTDPAFQALLAQLGHNEDLARQQVETQKAIAGRNAATQVPRIQEQGIEQRRAINFGAESRGMFRSGERLRNLSLQQRGESQRLADVYSGLSDRMAALDLGLQGKINDIANQRVSANLEASMRKAGV